MKGNYGIKKLYGGARRGYGSGGRICLTSPCIWSNLECHGPSCAWPNQSFHRPSGSCISKLLYNPLTLIQR